MADGEDGGDGGMGLRELFWELVFGRSWADSGRSFGKDG